ncbi:Gis3p Ecym_4293 [Eremothecium cymbalariae DBVPG|uniref:Uncharacterized protein n=1 Tax=Eremothecium cymbalariae (strain CBS 270.75 / DBVPG 7215 / KCTC 17166 / NRRL Y-17582) TaxID=931890 RepID=G8JTK3_ERECY|nr:hypothetical protein Ecym_4293 [Eremothecium cymbalariae DBVPG\
MLAGASPLSSTKKQRKKCRSQSFAEASYHALPDLEQQAELGFSDTGVISRANYLESYGNGLVSEDEGFENDEDGSELRETRPRAIYHSRASLNSPFLRRRSSNLDGASGPNLSLTPSLSSVMSQVRKFNNLASSVLSSGTFGGASYTSSNKRRDTASLSSSSSSSNSRRRACDLHILASTASEGGIQKFNEVHIDSWFGEDDGFEGEGEYEEEEEEEEEGEGEEGVQFNGNAGFDHPLTMIGDEGEESFDVYGSSWEAMGFNFCLPRLKCINPQDFDLQDTWTEEDIIQFYPPVYRRPQLKSSQKASPNGISTRRASVELTIDEMKNVGMMMEHLPSITRPRSALDTVELEHWPSNENDGTMSSTQVTKMIDTEENWLDFHLPNRRTRQSSLNPNFLRLYALELSCKVKSILPDLNVDEHVLKKLSYDDIWNLNIPNTHENVSPYQIKLALITRRKLWTDMCNILRQDLHGVNAPWNLKFVSGHSTNQDTEKGQKLGSTTSLVRVKSDVKPWSKDGNRFMLRPCGKLSMGKSSNRDIQYVVKGWCDSRFC